MQISSRTVWKFSPSLFSVTRYQFNGVQPWSMPHKYCPKCSFFVFPVLLFRILYIVIFNQGKGKGHQRTGHEGPEGEQKYSSTLSLTSALDMVGGQRHAPAALLLGKRPGAHCIGGWVGLRAGLGGCGKSHLPPGFDPRTVQPIASRYIDWATAVSYIQLRSNYIIERERFVWGLLNDVQRRIVEWPNDESDRIWKEAVVALPRLSRRLRGVTEKSHGQPNRDSRISLFLQR